MAIELLNVRELDFLLPTRKASVRGGVLCPKETIPEDTLLHLVDEKLGDPGYAYRVCRAEDMYGLGRILHRMSVGGCISPFLIPLQHAVETAKELESVNMAEYDPIYEVRRTEVPRPGISVKIVSSLLRGWDVDVDLECDVRPLIVVCDRVFSDKSRIGFCVTCPEVVSMGLTLPNTPPCDIASAAMRRYEEVIATGTLAMNPPTIRSRRGRGSQVMGKAAQYIYEHVVNKVSIIHHVNVSKMILYLVVSCKGEGTSVHKFGQSSTVLLEKHLVGSQRSSNDTLSVYTDEGQRGMTKITVTRGGYVQFLGRWELGERLFSRLKWGLESMLYSVPATTLVGTMEAIYQS